MISVSDAAQLEAQLWRIAIRESLQVLDSALTRLEAVYDDFDRRMAEQEGRTIGEILEEHAARRRIRPPEGV